jgi:hypothetical protein
VYKNLISCTAAPVGVAVAAHLGKRFGGEASLGGAQKNGGNVGITVGDRLAIKQQKMAAKKW